MTTLYHYTCSHGAAGIKQLGAVYPNWHPWLDVPLAWFTNSPTPDPIALGLTSDTLDCDRTQYRFRALEVGSLVPWLGSTVQAAAPLQVQVGLQSLGQPSLWWISRKLVKAVYDDQ